MTGPSTQITWCRNIPELLGLPDFGLDDADVDALGNVYVSDGVNGRVYKLGPDGSLIDSFSVVSPSDESSLNLAVAPDSTFCLADAVRETVYRYDEAGVFLGEFAAPGVLSLCPGPEGLIYVLSNEGGVERIDCYDALGSPVEMLPAPARHRAHLDAGLANLDADPAGNVYVSYGMPPYRIWKVHSDGSAVDAWSRTLDHPEDAVLISDIALDSAAGVLRVLLARRESGRQTLDAFSPDGEFLGSTPVTHSDSLYGVICASADGGLYLLETGNGPGAGDLVRLSIVPGA